jgi:hypothetical protein
MLEELACTCERCSATLGENEFMLAMTTPDGERRAYECECGAVTVTVVSS